MKNIKMLNDNELEQVIGGTIESSNIVGYTTALFVREQDRDVYILNAHHEEYQDR